MTLTILHSTLTPLTLLLFVFLARPRANPFLDTAGTIRSAITTRGGRIVLGVILAVLGVNFVECVFDPAITAGLGYDLTPTIRTLEGDFVERVQAGVPRWSLLLLTWFYNSGYIAALATPLVVWTACRRFDALRGYAGAFAANYIFALPFYFLFPVQEVAWSGISAAQPLMEVPWPGFTAELRAGSALDNCFPSLHVSCTTTLAWCATRHGPRGLRILGWCVAILTAWTVMALGIHWALDVAVGVPFGILCAIVGERIARRVSAGAAASPSRGDSASRSQG